MWPDWDQHNENRSAVYKHSSLAVDTSSSVIKSHEIFFAVRLSYDTWDKSKSNNSMSADIQLVIQKHETSDKDLNRAV